jgi:hypothetical protein
LFIGGTVVFLGNLRAVLTFTGSYCGHRYMMPWERDLNGAITFIIQPPGSEPQAASMTQQSTASRGYLQKIQSQLQNASHAFAPFSPLIIMVTISTISAFAFVSRITISIFPGWLARWKQLIWCFELILQQFDIPLQYSWSLYLY